MYNLYISNVMKLVYAIKPLDDVKAKKIRFIFKCFYYTITKLVIILLLSILFKTLLTTSIMCLSFIVLRAFSGGIHAKNNYICWVITLLLFCIIPAISPYVIIPNIIYNISFPILVICYFIWSPNDTKKRPIKTMKEVYIKKIVSLITIGILSILIHYNWRSDITFCIFMAEIITLISISPITYKLFNCSGFNYKQK